MMETADRAAAETRAPKKGQSDPEVALSSMISVVIDVAIVTDAAAAGERRIV
jgi:hypothetical protein